MKKTFFFMAALMASAVMMAQTPTVSASKVTMKYCKTTYGTVTVRTDAFPVVKDGFTFPNEGTYVRKMDNTRGCDSVVTYVIIDKKGSLEGLFSVANGKQVQFSKGVLQFKSSNGITYPTSGCLKHTTATGEAAGQFQFASAQYITAGNTHNNNGQGNPNDQEWQDIFGRGASGVNTHPCYLTDDRCDNFAGTNNDWGVFNAIENGGKAPGIWRLMTQSEWSYLFGKDKSGNTVSPCRTNANQKWGWGHITVNSTTINGVILLPDSWTLPSTCTWSAQNSNYYDATKWAAMEAAGAVFLPTTGYNQGGNNGYRVDNQEAYFYTSDGNFYGFENYGWNGYSACSGLYGFVRLVKDAQ